MKFYKCNICGQVIQVVKDTGVVPHCCDTEMSELVPYTDEAEFKEKHIPIYKVDNNKVVTKIGSIPHPMEKQHYIEWILLVTNKGCQKKQLTPEDKPEAEFYIGKDECVKEIYAYCNIHSLWKTTNKDCK